jgi:flagellar biosynthesis regulator FlaF
MDNQHQKIKGYRDLSQDEIDLMNAIKDTGEQIGKLIDAVNQWPDTDKRWSAIAKTDLQTGIMALVRSIARPTTF